MRPMLPPEVVAWWSGKRVLVTGGTGFLGSHITDLLRTVPGCVVIAVGTHEADLTHAEETAAFVAHVRPHVVIHAAAVYGGTAIHQTRPADIGAENVLMAVHLLDACRDAGVDRVIFLGSDCAYPGDAPPQPLQEEQLWMGAPHQSTGTYGGFKRFQGMLAQAYARQHSMDVIELILTNMYGPRDHFEPDRSHVVAALIKKFVDAAALGAPEVEVWGTGAPLRNFLFVADAAEAVVRAGAVAPSGTVMNVAAAEATSVRLLAEMLTQVSRYSGTIRFAAERGDGQVNKVLDTTRMRALLGWQPPTALRDGLEETVAWYRAQT